MAQVVLPCQENVVNKKRGAITTQSGDCPFGPSCRSIYTGSLFNFAVVCEVSGSLTTAHTSLLKSVRDIPAIGTEANHYSLGFFLYLSESSHHAEDTEHAFRCPILIRIVGIHCRTAAISFGCNH